MTRDDAERLFVAEVMKSGNPEKFLFAYARQLHYVDLEDELEELIDDVVSIEDD